MKLVDSRHGLFWTLLTLLAAANSGCMPDGPTDGNEDDEGVADEADQAVVTRTTVMRCSECAPPFVEHRGQKEFSGQLIVRPVQHAAPERDRRARERIAANIVKYYPEVDEYVIHVPATGARGDGENRVATSLMATNDYEYATPNWTLYPLATPNDPQYGSQWHLPKIQAPQAWDVQKGSSTMILAFTDTGIDLNHADLASRRVPGFNAVTDLAEANGGQVNDVHGHGTHVAGCAAAIGNNGVGVSGVGWNFKLMMVRVTNTSDGLAYTDDITQGARWAADNGARVVSSSYSGIDSPRAPNSLNPA